MTSNGFGWVPSGSWEGPRKPSVVRLRGKGDHPGCPSSELQPASLNHYLPTIPRAPRTPPRTANRHRDASASLTTWARIRHTACRRMRVLRVTKYPSIPSLPTAACPLLDAKDVNSLKAKKQETKWGKSKGKPALHPAPGNTGSPQRPTLRIWRTCGLPTNAGGGTRPQWLMNMLRLQDSEGRHWIQLPLFSIWNKLRNGENFPGLLEHLLRIVGYHILHLSTDQIHVLKITYSDHSVLC